MATLTYPVAPGTTQAVSTSTDGLVTRVALVDAAGAVITTLPVSGTVTATPSGTQAVSGPLTDTQLRATPVPVSGVVSSTGLTDAELRADAVATTAIAGDQTTGGFFPVRLSNGSAFLDAPQTGPTTVNATASGSTQLIAAPAAGNQIVLYQASVHQRAATALTVGLRAGTAGTNVVLVPLDATIGTGSLVPLGRGWILPAATGLFVNLSVAGNVQVNLLDYSVQAVPA